MITRYLDEAMRRARYTGKAGAYSATVPGLRGVIAHARSLEACRNQLLEVIEEWVLVRIAHGLPIPRLGRATVRVQKAG
jgi:predicted RNase H-like HicB family nuclease